MKRGWLKNTALATILSTTLTACGGGGGSGGGGISISTPVGNINVPGTQQAAFQGLEPLNVAAQFVNAGDQQGCDAWSGTLTKDDSAIIDSCKNDILLYHKGYEYIRDEVLGAGITLQELINNNSQFEGITEAELKEAYGNMKLLDTSLGGQQGIVKLFDTFQNFIAKGKITMSE